MATNTAVQTAATAGKAAPSADLSLLGLLADADIVVQGVVALLVLGSVWSWAIIFEKALRIRRLKQRSDTFEDSFWSGGSLETLYDRLQGQVTDPMAAVFVAAMGEWRRAASRGQTGNGLRASLVERIEKVMNITVEREMDHLGTHLTFLASLGSTAPFIGLFGTVWGIMNSFQSIAHAKSTNLAVVAPGIAEALFATALGLVAAIPAVVAYNKLSNELDRYAHRLETFAAEFGAILSRQLDERG